MLQNPVAFARLWFGRWLWRKQRDVLASIRANKNTAVASGHGVGKSEIGGIAAAWWLPTHPRGMVITTAPTDRQNVKILWARINTLHALAARRTVRLPSGRTLTGLGGELLIKEWRYDADWFGLAVSAKHPENFAGWHAEGGVLAIIEEASGVSDDVFSAARAIVTGPHDRLLAIGNPTQPTGYFHAIWHKPEVMPEWQRITISCEDVTDDDRRRIPGLVSREWIEAMIREWGRESDFCRVRVFGQFPHGTGQILMRLEDIDYAMARDDLQPGRPIVIGVDLSRGGQDKTVLVRVAGDVMTHIEKYGHGETDDAMVTVQRVERMFHEKGADAIAVDVGGLGGPIFDRLKELGYPVLAFSAHAAAADPETYHNLASNGYHALAMDIQRRLIQLIDDDELRGQLWDQPYEYRQGRLKTVSKEERHRKGRRSPDCSDALVIARWGQWAVKEAETQAKLTPQISGFIEA